MTAHPYWFAFSLARFSTAQIRAFDRVFGSLVSAWSASPNALRDARIPPSLIERLTRERVEIRLEDEFLKLERARAYVITFDSDEYPELLKHIPDPPPTLYVRGTVTPGDSRALAIVGTRKATAYGRDVAGKFAGALVQQGVTIVSGLAHGIDSAAHRGAIEGGGRTFAVLGCGVDQVYPPDHRDLAELIMAHGAILSEFPLGAHAERHHFPRRNRIISGLSLGVLVAEAPRKSGSLITAQAAGEQGREVFAVPGSILHEHSQGAHDLIRDGAMLVTSPDDILDALDIAHAHVQTRTTAERIAPANPIEAQLLGVLTDQPTHVDEIARICELPIVTVSSTLTLLELKGLARNVGHMQYSLSS